MLTLSRWYGHLLDAMMTAAGLLLLAMTVMIGADVLLRNIGAGGIPPSNELSEDCLYLITLLAAPGLLRQGQHIRIDIVLRALPFRLGWLLEWIGDALGIVCCLVFVWYGARVAEFVQSLAAIPEAGGTMLDNTLIMFFSEVGQWHEHNDVPLAIIGGKNLGNVGNRVLRYSRQVNDVGMAIAKQLQLPVTTFGDARWFKGPAPELFA